MKYCDTCHSAYPDDFTTCPRDQAALRHASDLLAGMILRGKYEILEKIGSGGMAAVYRARHVAFGEIRAIKVVGPRLAHEDSFLRRFKTEAVVTRRLQHPNAVRVDDLDTTEDGRPFIVMEYVEGPNLREVIRRGGALAPARAVEIARQVASALAAAHALGVTHRDIKPDNIILTKGPDGRELAKVLDFGIAKVREGAMDTGEGYQATQTGMVVGTPQYVSPEQAMGKRGDEVDGRSDVYSLGVVLYEMITGRLPFQSDTAMGMILHHLQTAPTPPDQIRPDLGIPAALSDVLMRALQKDRDLRFASASAMGEALEEVARLPLPDTAPAPAVDTEGETGLFPAAQRPTPKPPATVLSDAVGASTRVVLPVTGTPSVPTPQTVMSPRPRGRWRRYAVTAFALILFFAFLTRGRHRPGREAVPADSPAPASAESPSDDASPSDVQIQALVEKALRGSAVTAREPIDVEVDEGTVELSGDVSSGSASEVAAALAEAVPGVHHVRNRLDVSVPESPEAAERSELPEIAPPVPPFPALPPAARTHPRPPGMPAPGPDTPQGQALQRVLADGRRALQREDGEAAVAAYSAAVSLDPMSAEAREGLQRAIGLSVRNSIDPSKRPQRRKRESPSPPAGAP